MANTISTILFRQKVATAHLNGTSLPQVTQVGWGTGGVDINGNVLASNGNAIVVPGEVIRNNVISKTLSQDGLSITYHCSLSYDDPGVLNQLISSAGLYDDDGDLVAIQNFQSKPMDDGVIFVLDWLEQL